MGAGRVSRIVAGQADRLAKSHAHFQESHDCTDGHHVVGQRASAVATIADCCLRAQVAVAHRAKSSKWKQWERAGALWPASTDACGPETRRQTTWNRPKVWLCVSRDSIMAVCRHGRVAATVLRVVARSALFVGIGVVARRTDQLFGTTPRVHSVRLVLLERVFVACFSTCFFNSSLCGAHQARSFAMFVRTRKTAVLLAPIAADKEAKIECDQLVFIDKKKVFPHSCVN